MAEDVVRARRFELVDDEGRTRLTLMAGGPEGTAGLTIIDAYGEVTATLSATAEGHAALTIGPATGNASVLVGAFHEGGEDAQCFVRLTDREGRTRAFLALDEEGNPHLALLDEEGKAVRHLGTT